MKRLALWPLLLFLLAAGCQKCRREAPPDAGPAVTLPPPPPPWRALVEILPAGLHWGVVAGDGPGLLAGARALLSKLRGTTLGMLAEEYVRLAQHRLGFGEADPLDPAAWRARGLVPARGGALVAVDARRGLLLFGVADPAKAEVFLEPALKKSEGARSSRKVDGLTLAIDADGKPTAFYGFHAGYGVYGGPVASDTEAKELFARVASPQAKRLVNQPSWAALGGSSDFARGATALLFPEALQEVEREVRDLFGAFRGLSVRVEPSAGGAAVAGFVATTREYAASVQRVLPGGPGAGLATRLADDAVLALSGRVDLGALLKMILALVPPIEQGVRAAFERLKKKLDVDVEKELFQNLTGDGALAIHKLEASAIPLLLGASGPKALGAEPFHVSLLLNVRDPVVAAKFLRKMAILADVPLEKEGAVEVFPLSLARLAGEERSAKGGAAIRFALSGSTLVATLGKGRMQKALAVLAGTLPGFAGKVQDPETRKAFDVSSMPVGYVHGGHVAENLREVESVLLRNRKLLLSSLVQKATEVVERFADVSLGGEPTPEGQRFWLRVRFK